MIKILRASIIAGLFAGLLMPFVYTPVTTFPFVFGKAITFAILVEIIVALYAVLVIVSPEDRPRGSAILWCVLAYAAAILVSTFVGWDPHRSFWGNHERMSGVFTVLHFIAYYLVARSVLRTKRLWTRLLAVFLATSAVMAGLAIAEHSKGLFMDQAGGRVWATLGNYIYLAVYMLFAAFVAGYLLTETRNRWLQALVVAVGLLDLYVLFLTETRAALIAVLLSLLIIPFIAAWQAKGRTRNYAIAAAVLLVFVGVGLYLARDNAVVASIPGLRRVLATNLTGAGDRTRILAWEVALDAWKAKWLFGWGPENFYAAFNVFYRPESLIYSYYETWFDRAHNSVLDMLAMTGVVGTFFSLGLYATAAYTVLRRLRRASLTAIQAALFLLFLGAYFFQNLFAFDALSGFLLFYLLLAFIDAEPKAEEPPIEAAKRLPTVAAVAIAAPLVFGCLWLVVLNVRMWQGNAVNLNASMAIRTGQFAEASRLHTQALAYGSPHASELRADFAREAAGLLGQIPSGREKEALTLLQTAVDNLRQNVAEGKDAYDGLMLAQILMSSNSPPLLAEAEQILKSVVPLSPRRQQILYTLARAYILQNRAGEAVTLLRQIVADEPRVAESHWVLALALYEAGNQEGAWQEMVEAMKRNYVWGNSGESDLAVEVGKKYGPPTEAVPLAAYAEAEATAGATSTAREHMKKALELEPTPALKYRAQMLWDRIGAP
jgi:O-antigen ligase